MNRILANRADLYNLFIIYTIFHELWHFKKSKELVASPNATRSLLLASSKIFAKYSFHTDYQVYHNKFYFEYDANIHAIMMTLDFVEQLSLDGNTLQILNSFFAKVILDSYDKYGLEQYKNSYDRYTLSPLEYFKFFFSEIYLREINSQEIIIISELENFLSTFDFFSTDGINNLYDGYPISAELIAKLIDIADNKSGRIKTTNILRELQPIYESDRHI